jgi:hypothetical protein
MSKTVIVILIYHHHKPIEFKIIVIITIYKYFKTHLSCKTNKNENT